MKFSKFLFCAGLVWATFGAWADAGNTLVTFSTKGPDVYADGKPAADGEWYALCWSPTASFGGITSTCQAANEGEKVLLVAPLAEGGRCPTVVFQLDSKTAPKSGNYFIYMLDTRDVNGKAAKAGANNLPITLNAVIATEAKAACPKDGAAAQVTATGAALASADTWAASDVSDVPAPLIKAFEISGEKAVITVSGLVPSVRYNVFAGETPDAITETPVSLPATGTADAADVKFVLDADKGKFFRIGRQPIK